MSFFLFPFYFKFLPGVNTKMMMAIVGLFFLFFKSAVARNTLLNTQMLVLSLFAISVSVVGFISTTINNTHDYVYATYVVSMWVWLSAAYAVVCCVEEIYGYVDIPLVAKYIIWVCVAQCVIAISMEFIPWMKNFVDSFLNGYGFMGKADDRIYGIGCALDVAGLKFCGVLSIISWIMTRSYTPAKDIKYYITAFIIIGIIGCMISRTTAIGIGMALVIMAATTFRKRTVQSNVKRIWRNLCILLIILVPVTTYLYQTNSIVYKNLRFGFEGFFSLVEEGEWKVESNHRLSYMVELPDNEKTWLIGDGYFNNPSLPQSESLDPFYIGPNFKGDYYMGTDIGYLRFIYYFGLIGLATFIIYFVKTTQICCNRFPRDTIMFLSLLLVNLIGWFKVSSDIFPLFAVFLAMPRNSSRQTALPVNNQEIS